GRVLLTLTRNRDHGQPRDRRYGRAETDEGSPVDARQGGRRLTALMDTRGLTIGDLAADLGVSRDAVAQWRQGRHTPAGDVAERVARRLGIDPGQLSTDRGPHSRDGIAR
ncbi:MAG: helix-turn-helix domain-containing protein, partial [Micromonosporaceae bacterium]|nr:helix-turn-helix domain-containing protein [Micromonosporaceae bacterium]